MKPALKPVLSLLTALLCLLPISLSADPTAQPKVVKLTIHDTIQPITADYLQRGLDEAARQHAAAVLVSLGTPGGLLESTRVMVQAIENSPVPVIIFISPPGSRAGSAGFFLLEAADIAAMAPGTNAGAAHPIVVGKSLDPVLKQKIENDAAAFLRSFASRRGRNVEAAEDAIRNSKSYSDEESLKLKLIDLVSADDASLLSALDNREIRRFNGTKQTLHLSNASIVTIRPSLRERVLSKVANPDIAVFLLVLGCLLIYLEFNVPGTVVPGSIGTLFVLLALFGLNLLPVRHTAVAAPPCRPRPHHPRSQIRQPRRPRALRNRLARLRPRHPRRRPHPRAARPPRHCHRRRHQLRSHLLRPRLDRPPRPPGQDPHRPSGNDRRASHSPHSPLPHRPGRDPRRTLAGPPRRLSLSPTRNIRHRPKHRRPHPYRPAQRPRPRPPGVDWKDNSFLSKGVLS